MSCISYNLVLLLCMFVTSIQWIHELLLFQYQSPGSRMLYVCTASSLYAAASAERWTRWNRCVDGWCYWICLLFWCSFVSFTFIYGGYRSSPFNYAIEMSLLSPPARTVLVEHRWCELRKCRSRGHQIWMQPMWT